MVDEQSIKSKELPGCFSQGDTGNFSLGAPTPTII